MLDQLIIHPLMAVAQLLGVARRPCLSGRNWRLDMTEYMTIQGDVLELLSNVPRWLMLSMAVALQRKETM